MPDRFWAGSRTKTTWPSRLRIWRGVSILETPATEDNETKTALNATEEVGYIINFCTDQKTRFVPNSLQRIYFGAGGSEIQSETCSSFSHVTGPIHMYVPSALLLNSVLPKNLKMAPHQLWLNLHLTAEQTKCYCQNVYYRVYVNVKRHLYPPQMRMQWTSHVEIS